MSSPALITSSETNVFPRELDRAYPQIVRAKGVRLWDSAGNEYLDAISGGAMVTSLGHGVEEIAEVAAARPARSPTSTASSSRVRGRSGSRRCCASSRRRGSRACTSRPAGAEANETALRLARSYHVERGEPGRWRIISPAQAYHGPTVATLALTGRPQPAAALRSVRRRAPPHPAFDLALRPERRGGARRAGRGAGGGRPGDGGRVLLRAGERRRAARLLAAGGVLARSRRAPARARLPRLPRRGGDGPGPDRQLVRRRAGCRCAPDIIATAKGLGAGYVPIGAMLCTDAVYDAVADGSRAFELGHTWSGAPLQCAVGLAVIDHLRRHGLVERVAERGPRLLGELRQALEGSDLVREVRGRGFLLGIDYVDPRDGRVVPRSGPRRGAAHRQRGARARAARLLDPADRRRLRRRPDAARAGLRQHATPSWPRWSSGWRRWWTRSRAGQGRLRRAPPRSREQGSPGGTPSSPSGPTTWWSWFAPWSGSRRSRSTCHRARSTAQNQEGELQRFVAERLGALGADVDLFEPDAAALRRPPDDAALASLGGPADHRGDAVRRRRRALADRQRPHRRGEPRRPRALDAARRSRPTCATGASTGAARWT